MKRKIKPILCFFAMGILILDTKTALQGASDGITLCTKTVVPSLFPFIVLSMLLTSSLLGKRMVVLRPIGRLLRIPEGSESIWLIGSLGGYPVGAQSIGQAVKSGVLSQKDGRRMLCFCSNAGPSFIFGIGMGILGDIRLCFLVWLIHILSSILVGILTPGKAESSAMPHTSPPLTLPQVIPKATATMAMICGWVIVFRILLSLLQKWILIHIPEIFQILLSGVLELSNGCVCLAEAESMTPKILLFSIFLAFGGVCVAMQTHSAVADTEITRWYLPAKLAQGACSAIFSAVAAKRLFPAEAPVKPGWIIICGICLISYHVLLRKNIDKKALAFKPVMMYNGVSLHTR